LKLPTPQTLKKYGLSEQEWIKLYNKFGGRCHVCLRKPINATRALHVDHEHVKGWKDMPPNERKKYIRGLSCYTCNRFRLTRGTNIKNAKNMYAYLKRYENSKVT